MTNPILVTGGTSRLGNALVARLVGFQPVDIGEVADRLTSVACSRPRGRADDMSGGRRT